MSAFASTLINWSAVWKITLVALVGGAGVVIAFGLMLAGHSRAGKAESARARFMHRALIAVCGAFCFGSVTIGIYAMTQKPH